MGIDILSDLSLRLGTIGMSISNRAEEGPDLGPPKILEYGNDVQNHNDFLAGAATSTSDLSLNWTATNKAFHQPKINDGIIYFDDSSTIHAANLDDGSNVWTSETIFGITGQAVDPDTSGVYVIAKTTSGAVSGLEIADGTTRWQITSPDDARATAIVRDGKVIGKAEELGTKLVLAVNPSDGSIIWSKGVSSTEGVNPAQATQGDGKILITDGTAFVYTKVSDGSTVWSTETNADNGINLTSAFRGGAIYVDGTFFAAGQQTDIYGVDEAAGSLVFNSSFGELGATPDAYPASDGTNLYWPLALSNGNSGVVSFTPGGTVNWTTDVSQENVTNVTYARGVDGDVLYVGGLFTGLKILDPGTGAVLDTLSVPSRVQRNVTPGDGFLLVPQNDSGTALRKYDVA